MPNPKTYRPRKYQEPAIEFMLSRAAAGIFCKPGGGKTGITLCATEILKEEGMVKKVLVLATRRIIRHVWPVEIEEFNFNLTWARIHGTEEQKLEALAQDVDIHLTTYDTFKWLLPYIQRGNIKYDMLVIDESSKFKNKNTNRFKYVEAALNTFKRRYILTGSPRPNHLLDIWSQIYLLDAGYSLSPYITHFRCNYFQYVKLPGKEWPIWVPQITAEKKIFKKLEPYVYVIPDKAIKGPKRNPITIKIDLPPKVRKLYKQLERDLIAAYENDIIHAANAGVLTGKLRQIANGGVYAGRGEKITKQLHYEKAEAVKEIIDELHGSPALIGYEFDHDRQRLLKVLGKNTLDFGKLTDKKAEEVRVEWNSGNIEYMISQFSSISHGLNLQEAGNTVIAHSMIWNQDDYDQYIRRVQRSGNKSLVVNVFNIIAADTVDLAILASLRKKARGQQAMFDALSTYVDQVK